MNHAAPPADPKNKLKRVGILGCGAIGSRIARSIKAELSNICLLGGLYDIDPKKSDTLTTTINCPSLKMNSFEELLSKCDLMFEAVNSECTLDLIQQALLAEKDVLTMSVGKLLHADKLFSLASQMKRSLIVPSGAIAGIDAVKSASLANVKTITLTTRKPIAGFMTNEYIKTKGINLASIKTETTIFEGNVDDAVRFFPQNINVAATLALASGAKNKIFIRIITSPDYINNSHEIEVIGDFGRMKSITENVVCPDNPKTSYLAVLSGIETLKEFCTGVHIGT